MDEQDDILTTSEAADLLKVNPTVLRRWAAAGTVPAGRLGNRNWRFSRKALIEWLFERGAGRQKRGSKPSSKRRGSGRTGAN